MPYSNSQLDQYRKCPLSMRYKYMLRLRKRDDEGARHHQEFSLAMHEALRVLYSGGAMKEAQSAFLEAYPVQLNPDDWAKTRENGVAALEAYGPQLKSDLHKWKVLTVEQLERGEDEFIVKLDLIAEDKETGQIYSVDHKVTGRYLNYDYFKEFEPNSQVSEYVKFVRERYGYCDGFIVNAIALRHRQRAYKGEPAGPWFAFERQMFNVNERQSEQALASREYWIDRVEHSKSTGVFGMNTQQCRFCDYREICKAGWSYPEDAELIDLTYRRICGRWHGEPLQPCALDRGHEGEHSATIPERELFQVEVEV